jgi:hypothetical protein
MIKTLNQASASGDDKAMSSMLCWLRVKVTLLLSLNPKRACMKNTFCTRTLRQWWSSISPQNKFSQLLMVSGVVLLFLGIEKDKSCREPLSQFCKIADAKDCHGI